VAGRNAAFYVDTLMNERGEKKRGERKWMAKKEKECTPSFSRSNLSLSFFLFSRFGKGIQKLWMLLWYFLNSKSKR